MYIYGLPTKSTLLCNESYVGETIEEKINRIVNNKEPISDGAPITYTERKDGILPEHDIRTDKWEIAIGAMDKVAETHRQKREERIKSLGEQAKEGQNIESKTDQKPGDTGTTPATTPTGGSK